jgi:phospholipase C
MAGGPRWSRREILGGVLGAGVLTATTSCGSPGKGAAVASGPSSTAATIPPPAHRLPPGSLPNPRLPAGTDTVPQVEHIVVVMQENHSFDNYFGMLGRGDGFALDRHGRPINANPDPNGGYVRAFHESDTCQPGGVSQSWNASHIQLAGGRNDGFVRSYSGVWAMAYFDDQDIPFYYSLGKTFPVCDRYFSSVLAQTYPNRRFLLAGTAFGLISTDTSSITQDPPNGTIVDRLNTHGISWKSYASNISTMYIIASVPQHNPANITTMAQFFADTAAGTLPAVSYVDSNIFTGDEENPQDIQLGEAFVSSVVQAVMSGPAWSKTMLIWTYDEHGGYYDHVPPPPAIAPDNIPPGITVPPDQQGGYDRYGFRVPTVVVSPRGRRDFVSHTIYDHTSVLKTIERKWNLPAMTYRDANARDLLDCLDLTGQPAFLDPPHLAPPANPTGKSHCPATAPTQPPAGALVTTPPRRN